jgi:hypothetical protein
MLHFFADGLWNNIQTKIIAQFLGSVGALTCCSAARVAGL